MKITAPYARLSAGVLGGVLLLGGAGAAMAAEVENDDVKVNVNIEARGALTMSVAAASTNLTEVDSDDEDYRQFTGALPTVTVSDSRENVPVGQSWYVTGQSTAFATTPASDVIGADRLGWTPTLVANDEANGEVTEGGETVPSVDAPTDGNNNVGLENEELLALSLDSGEAAVVGSWSVNAPLVLKADADVSAGAYAATITLSLWEDATAVPTP